MIAILAAGHLLAGALLSVAVAWALAYKSPPPGGTESEATHGEEHLSVTVWNGFGMFEAIIERKFGQNWSPIRAAGPPDTPRMGDLPSAWASLTPDDQAEWLELDYQPAIVCRTIQIYETNAPGALIRVNVFDATGQQFEAWHGLADPAAPDARGIYVAAIPISLRQPIRRVRIDLDSPKIAGWNEIDAVALIDESGGAHWATSARASSTFGSRSQQPGTGTLEQINELLPRWLKLSSQYAPNVPPVSQRRAFVARGFPFLALWRECEPNDPSVNLLEFRHPIWFGLTADASLYGAISFALYCVTFGTRRFVRESLRLRRGHCMNCGYDLRFDLAAGCPECGWRRISK